LMEMYYDISDVKAKVACTMTEVLKHQSQDFTSIRQFVGGGLDTLAAKLEALVAAQEAMESRLFNAPGAHAATSQLPIGVPPSSPSLSAGPLPPKLPDAEMPSASPGAASRGCLANSIRASDSPRRAFIGALAVDIEPALSRRQSTEPEFELRPRRRAATADVSLAGALPPQLSSSAVMPLRAPAASTYPVGGTKALGRVLSPKKATTHEPGKYLSEAASGGFASEEVVGPGSGRSAQSDPTGGQLRSRAWPSEGGSSNMSSFHPLPSLKSIHGAHEDDGIHETVTDSPEETVSPDSARCSTTTTLQDQQSFGSQQQQQPQIQEQRQRDSESSAARPSLVIPASPSGKDIVAYSGTTSGDMVALLEELVRGQQKLAQDNEHLRSELARRPSS